MPRYSLERKTAVLDKMLPPHNLSIPEVASQEGISAGCLYNWLKQARLEGRPVPGSRKNTPDDWPSQDKMAVVIETASLNAQELGEYCRLKGLYPEQISRWKEAFIQALGLAKPDAETKETRKKYSSSKRKFCVRTKPWLKRQLYSFCKKKSRRSGGTGSLDHHPAAPRAPFLGRDRCASRCSAQQSL